MVLYPKNRKDFKIEYGIFARGLKFLHTILKFLVFLGYGSLVLSKFVTLSN